MSTKPELVQKTKLKKDKNKLYIVDKDGDIAETGVCGITQLNPTKYVNPKKIEILNIIKEKGYLYFVGKDGDVYRNQIKEKYPKV